jgi:hypothetical protein
VHARSVGVGIELGMDQRTWTNASRNAPTCMVDLEVHSVRNLVDQRCVRAFSTETRNLSNSPKSSGVQVGGRKRRKSRVGWRVGRGIELSETREKKYRN